MQTTPISSSSKDKQQEKQPLKTATKRKNQTPNPSLPHHQPYTTCTLIRPQPVVSPMESAVFSALPTLNTEQSVGRGWPAWCQWRHTAPRGWVPQAHATTVAQSNQQSIHRKSQDEPVKASGVGGGWLDVHRVRAAVAARWSQSAWAHHHPRWQIIRQLSIISITPPRTHAESVIGLEARNHQPPPRHQPHFVQRTLP